MKLVPARHIVRSALERGELTRDTVVVETTSGTFGLALAIETALLGRRLVLVSDPVIDPNLHRRLTDLGARVDIVPVPDPVGGYQAARLRRLTELRATLPDTFCPEQYTNPANPASYAVVAEHITRSLGPVDALVGPVGSGGSLCGTARGLRSVSPDLRAIAVDTHYSVLFGQLDGLRALRGLGNSIHPANLDHGAIDEVHWCTAQEAYSATRQLHRENALYQGPTSGAAFLVARWWAERNRDALCVVMLPDEGHRYQQTVYDDQWLAESGYTLAPPAHEPVAASDPRAVADRWSTLSWERRTIAQVHGTEVAAR